MAAPRMTFRKVSSVSGDFIGNHAIFDIFFIRQTQVLFWSHITEHRCAIPSHLGRSDARRNMVVAWRNIGR